MTYCRIVTGGLDSAAAALSRDTRSSGIARRFREIVSRALSAALSEVGRFIVVLFYLLDAISMLCIWSMYVT